jgi:hypothetical protein
VRCPIRKPREVLRASWRLLESVHIPHDPSPLVSGPVVDEGGVLGEVSVTDGLGD